MDIRKLTLIGALVFAAAPIYAQSADTSTGAVSDPFAQTQAREECEDDPNTPENEAESDECIGAIPFGATNFVPIALIAVPALAAVAGNTDGGTGTTGTTGTTGN